MEIIDMELLNLPANLKALIECIEARSPLPLSFVDCEYTNCVSMFDDDACYVFLEVPEGLRHEVICHEVLHFQYCLDGFPMIEPRGGCPDYDDGTIIAAIYDITNIIEHQVIYPKMLQLGYDPYVAIDWRVQFELLPGLEKEDYSFGPTPPKAPKERHLFLVLLISATLLETSSSALRERVRELAQAKFTQALIVAERIVALIDGANTPQNYTRAVIDVIQLLGMPRETCEISCGVWLNKITNRIESKKEN